MPLRMATGERSGVVRDRLGPFEDQFFTTVFLGGGLLFLAMTFATSAIAGGMLGSYAAGARPSPSLPRLSLDWI